MGCVEEGHQPNHQRSPRGQPRHVRHQRETACDDRVRVGEKRSECPKTLDFLEAWLQIGCKNVLSICYQNDLNMYFRNAAEESAAFVVS